uniref:Uncharacterized protein n=1 Tax=Caenorhabditis japonica TaxID=281687 RepID=A0A8R1E3A0_CAEJA
MLRSFLLMVIVAFAFFGLLVQSQPIQDNMYAFNEGFERESEAPYLMNLLKRTAVFFPNGNHDKMIKAILKSRRY